MQPIQTRSSLSKFFLKNLLSLGGFNTRLSILIYHRVLAQPDPLTPDEDDAESFDKQMSWLTSCFNIIPLHEAVQKLRQNKLPPCTACITFDDGYADNATNALPILQKYGISATFFVSTGFLNGGRMWNDTIIEMVRKIPGTVLDLSKIGLGQFDISNTSLRRKTINNLLNKIKYLPLESRELKIEEICTYSSVKLPNDLMMTSEQIKMLYDSGMEIGGHTVSHPILACIKNVKAREEIANGKEMLESIIRSPVRAFAYPNGKPGQDYLSEHVIMVKDLGFKAAVSTSQGVAKHSSDMYQLPRISPWDTEKVRFTIRMAQNMLKNPEVI